MTNQPHKTRDDLDSQGLAAERHWRKFLPKMCRELEAKGELYDALVEAQEAAEQLMEDLWKKHVPAEVSEELAEREFILLPAEEDEPEVNPEQPGSRQLAALQKRLGEKSGTPPAPTA
jgi:hypothetical protein